MLSPNLTYKNGDDEFRPDITCHQRMPLAFIEVKKPTIEKVSWPNATALSRVAGIRVSGASSTSLS